MLSHELRTPLNAVLGWTQMLQLGELDEEEKSKAITTIEENALIQAQLIEDMLDVSRIVNNKLVMNYVPLYLQCPLWSAIQTIRPQAHQKKIEVIADVPSADVHPLIINADPFRLQQVMLNLLTNAVKFTPPGGIITVKADRAQSAARILIKDSGAGTSFHVVSKSKTSLTIQFHSIQAFQKNSCLMYSNGSDKLTRLLLDTMEDSDWD